MRRTVVLIGLLLAVFVGGIALGQRKENIRWYLYAEQKIPIFQLTRFDNLCIDNGEYYPCPTFSAKINNATPSSGTIVGPFVQTLPKVIETVQIGLRDDGVVVWRTVPPSE